MAGFTEEQLEEYHNTIAAEEQNNSVNNGVQPVMEIAMSKMPVGKNSLIGSFMDNVEGLENKKNVADKGNVNRYDLTNDPTGLDQEILQNIKKDKNVTKDGENVKIKKHINNVSDDEDTKDLIFNGISGKTNEENGDLHFKFPDWGYDDWLNERNMFQRGITSVGSNRSWFYFKIFFNFDTQHGLFGGLLNDDKISSATNSAGKFLHIAKNTYTTSKLNERYLALHKFASILSYIQSETPWFFKSISGVNNANYTGTDFTKEKFLEISTLPESIDLRLNTLADLYKFACYDEINYREIIPENLRKFDMSVLIFATPIAIMHDAIHTGTNRINFKRASNTNPQDFNNILSYKLYTFKNCEFMLADFNSFLPGELVNEAPFELGNGKFKIKYDRSYFHTHNEFMEMMFGSDGFYYNQTFKNYDFDINKIESKIKQRLRFHELKHYLLYSTVQAKTLYTTSDELSNSIIDNFTFNFGLLNRLGMTINRGGKNAHDWEALKFTPIGTDKYGVSKYARKTIEDLTKGVKTFTPAAHKYSYTKYKRAEIEKMPNTVKTFTPPAHKYSYTEYKRAAIEEISKYFYDEKGERKTPIKALQPRDLNWEKFKDPDFRPDNITAAIRKPLELKQTFVDFRPDNANTSLRKSAELPDTFTDFRPDNITALVRKSAELPDTFTDFRPDNITALVRKSAELPETANGFRPDNITAAVRKPEELPETTNGFKP